jgi:NAD(P)-dependent dehydrogenase (short-subunit alcohol dehydrogenase family)
VGKTAIITGANTGIGYKTASDFAKRGAKVILACRDPKRGQAAKERIIKETSNQNIVFKQLDLSSLTSVKQFAEDVIKTEDRLDILVNNAGAGGVGSKLTGDGLELLMQVNYFGHFLLTILLLGLIKKTSNSRIINVSSIAAKYAKPLDVNNLNQVVTKGWEESRLYAKTKLCNVLFTIELAKKLSNTTVSVYSLHPGAVLTDIFRRAPAFFKIMVDYVLQFYFKDSYEGAQTTIYCSVEKDIEYLSGHHFSDCHVVGRYKTAQDPDLPSKLWKVSEELVNLRQK